MKRVIKKLIFMLMFVAGTPALAQTKEIDPKQVPKAVREIFTKENPGITPAWKTDGKEYKAFFTDPKTKLDQVIVYDIKGVVQHRENALEDVPKTQ